MEIIGLRINEKWLVRTFVVLNDGRREDIENMRDELHLKKDDNVINELKTKHLFISQEDRLFLEYTLRTTDKKIIVQVPAPFNPYFFVSLETIQKYKNIFKNNLKISREYELIKVEVLIPSQVGQLRDRLFKEAKKTEDKVVIKEADITYTLRVSIDLDLGGIIKITGTIMHTKNNVMIIYDGKIEPYHGDIEILPKILSWDMEWKDDLKVWTPKDTFIRAISAVSRNEKKDLFWTYPPNEPEGERRILLEFTNELKNWDICAGFWILESDVPVLVERCKQYKIKIPIGNLQFFDYLWEYLDMQQQKPPRQSLSWIVDHETDGKYKKLPRETSCEYLWQNDLEYLKKYCLWDSKLVDILEDYLGYIDQKVGILNFSGIPISQQYRSTIVETTVMRYARKYKPYLKFGLRTWTKKREKGKYSGGLVLKPKNPGLLEAVIFLDFKGMYNSIIKYFNISPETKNDNGEIVVPNTDKNGFIDDKHPILARFTLKEKGIFPLCLEDLDKNRDAYKEKMSSSKKEREKFDKNNEQYKYFNMFVNKWNTMQKAIKTIILSFYGVLGQEGSRVYDPICAACVTAVGRWLIRNTEIFLSKMGYTILYGDTDGLFILPQSLIEDEIILEGKKLEKILNEYYHKLIIGQGVPEEWSNVIIKFEKGYKPFLFGKMAGARDEAPKKRYAAYEFYDEGVRIKSDKPIIKGFESVRSNSTLLTRELQKKVIIAVLNKKGESYINDFLDKTRRLMDTGALDKQLIIATRLGKPLKEYEDIGRLPHIRAAAKLAEQGHKITQGFQILYIMVRGAGGIPEPIPILDEDNIPKDLNIDYDYIWNHQIYPPCERVLSDIEDTGSLSDWF